MVLIRKGNRTETVDSTFPDLPILPTVASIEERIVKSEISVQKLMSDPLISNFLAF